MAPTDARCRSPQLREPIEQGRARNAIPCRSKVRASHMHV